MTKALKEHGVACELNLVEGSMTVRTTRKTWDPYIIVKARDLIKLLSRSVPAAQALKVLDDEVNCDVIKIGGMLRNKEKFVKRRQRLIGPNGSTLKAIELVTKCYMLVQGNTVSIMGGYKGLKVARRIVEDCIKNIHPIFHIKEQMVKRELENDPELAKENWDRFLPKFKKKNVQRRKPHKVRKKKEYTPFPPPQLPSKVDLQIESGEYFLSESAKKQAKAAEKAAKQQAKVTENKSRREAAFVAPKEAKYAGGGAGAPANGAGGVAEAVERLKARGSTPAGGPARARAESSDFLTPEAKGELARAKPKKEKKRKKSAEDKERSAKKKAKKEKRRKESAA